VRRRASGIRQTHKAKRKVTMEPIKTANHADEYREQTEQKDHWDERYDPGHKQVASGIEYLRKHRLIQCWYSDTPLRFWSRTSLPFDGRRIKLRLTIRGLRVDH
jgi:hypothetical protein